MRALLKLTPDQKKRVRGVPGLAERAARDAAKRFGQIRPPAEMIMSAHYGIAKAAQSYDATGGSSFEGWAFYKAIWTILDDARADQRQTIAIRAARLAAIEFLGFAQREPRDEDAHNTEAQDRGALDAFKHGLLAGMLQGVALMPLASGGEDDMIARVDAARAAAALDRIYADLRPEQVELLRCEGEEDFKALAPRWGKSWWTLARAHTKLTQIVGARLAGQGIETMPAWDDELWQARPGQGSARPPPGTVTP